jgi:hypothetical protein
MRVLEALKILEEATLDSKKRAIDTRDVRQALGVLDPCCAPKWRVDGFRDHLRPHTQDGVELEGQQQILRAYFDGIYKNVRQLLLVEIGKLNYRNRKTKDGAVKAKLDRLNSELEKLPEQWNFFVR